MQHMIPDLNINNRTILGDLRFSVQLIVDKDYPKLSCLFIKSLPLGIGAHIPIQDIDIALGIFLFQGDGRLYRMGAAHLGAIHITIFP